MREPMKNTITKCVFVIAGLLMLGGCTSILNPFQSEFACPDIPKGKCISIKEAYTEDVKSSTDGRFLPDETLPATEIKTTGSDSGDGQETPKEKTCCGGNKPDTKISSPMAPTPVVQRLQNNIPVQEYREASLKKITKLLRNPVTPIVAPPQVMRVLILPYEDDDGALNLQRFKYIMVDRAKWVLGDYLAVEEEGGE